MCGRFLHGNRETRQEPCPEATGSRAASMKERTRRIDAETSRESDGGIVPEKQPNKANPEAAEVVEGRPPAKRNTGEEATTGYKAGIGCRTDSKACEHEPIKTRRAALLSRPAWARGLKPLTSAV